MARIQQQIKTLDFKDISSIPISVRISSKPKYSDPVVNIRSVEPAKCLLDLIDLNRYTNWVMGFLKCLSAHRGSNDYAAAYRLYNPVWPPAYLTIAIGRVIDYMTGK